MKFYIIRLNSKPGYTCCSLLRTALKKRHVSGGECDVLPVNYTSIGRQCDDWGRLRIHTELLDRVEDILKKNCVSYTIEGLYTCVKEEGEKRAATT